MEGSGALSLALGHVRNAAAEFLGVDDPTGESIFLAAECLDLEGAFADVGVLPEFIEAGLGAAESLDAAAAELDSARDSVPLGLWAAVQALRARARR